MPRIYLFVLTSLLALSAHSADAPFIGTLHAGKRVTVRSIQIHTHIAGSYARTDIAVTLYNPNRRPADVELRFPLLPGQHVAAMKLDGIAATPIDGDRAGQERFKPEELPAPLAAPANTAVNVLALRTNEMPGCATQHVTLQIDEMLHPKDGAYTYSFPLDKLGRANHFQFTLSVDSDQAPQADGKFSSLRFPLTTSDWVTSLDHRNYSAPEALTISWNVGRKPYARSQALDDQRYFVAEIPTLPISTPRILPKVVGLLWDSSSHAANRQLGIDLALLDRYFQAMGNGEVRLTRLRHIAEETEHFTVENGRWDALRRALTETVNDGASMLDGWGPDPAVGDYLLFSDGHRDPGAPNFPTLLQGQRLYAVSSAPSPEVAWLSALTATNMGRYLPLASMGAVEDAANKLLHDPTRLLAISADGASQLTADSIFADDGMLRMAGVLDRPEAKLHVRYATSKGEYDTTVPVTARGLQSEVAGPVWAEERVAALAIDPQANSAESAGLTRQFALGHGHSAYALLNRPYYNAAPPTAAPLPPELPVFDKLAEAWSTQQAWWQQAFPKGPVPPSYRELLAHRITVTGSSIHRTLKEDALPVQVIYPDRCFLGRGGGLEEPTLRNPFACVVEQSVSCPPPYVTAIAIDQQWSTHANRTPGNAPERLLDASEVLAAPADKTYASYIAAKANGTFSTSSYIDISDKLFAQGQTELGLRVLSNVASTASGDHYIQHVLGRRLMQAGHADRAVLLLNRLLKDDPGNGGLVLDLAHAHLALSQAAEATEVLTRALLNSRICDSGYLVACSRMLLAEQNALLANHPVASDTVAKLDPRLLGNDPMDLRITMSAAHKYVDRGYYLTTHIHFIVTDPNGESSDITASESYQGGRVIAAMLDGIDAQEFDLRTAKPGKYKVEVDPVQIPISGPVQVDIATRFGTPNAKQHTVLVYPRPGTKRVLVAEFELPAAALQ